MTREEVKESIKTQGFKRVEFAGTQSLTHWKSTFADLHYYAGPNDSEVYLHHPTNPMCSLGMGIRLADHHLITKLSEVSERLAEHLWPILNPMDYQLKAKGPAVYAYCKRYPDPKLKGVILWENIFDGSPFNLAGFLELVKAVGSLDKLIEDFNNK